MSDELVEVLMKTIGRNTINRTGVVRMGKVKLTKCQAFMISNHKNHLESLITKRYNANCATSVDDLSFDDILSAYFGGYEVEEEFKVGDWVVCEDGYIGEIEFINEIKKWANIGDSKDTKKQGVCMATTYDLIDIVRHATSEEIAEEKQRRFWHGNGRKVWELKEGDVLNINDSYESIKEIYEGEYIFESGITEEVNNFNKLIEVGNVEVICFVHDRKDIKND